MTSKNKKISFEGFPSTVIYLQIYQNTLISACITGEILLWDLSNSKRLLNYQGHSLKITSINFHQPSHQIISTSEDCLIKFFNIATKSQTTIDTNSEINSSVLTPTNTLISGHSDKTIKIWDINSKRRLSVFHGHKFPVLAIIINKQGTELITGSCDSDIFLWNIGKSRIEHKFEGHTGYINTLTLNQSESQLFSGCSDGLIKVWQMCGKMRFLYNFRGHTQQVTHLKIFSKFLVSCSHDCSLRTWNLQSKICEKILQFENPVLAVDSGSYLYLSCSDNCVRVLEPENFNIIKLIVGHSGEVNKVVGNGECFITAGNDGYLKVWDLNSGMLKKSVNAHFGGVFDFDIVEGNVVASCGFDKKVKIWDLDSGECIKVFDIGTKNAYCLRVLKGNGKRIVFPFDEMKFCVCDLEGREGSRYIRVVNRKRGDVGFSKSLKYLVSRYTKNFVFVLKILA